MQSVWTKIFCEVGACERADSRVSARPDFPPRSRRGTMLQASFALYIGIQAAQGDADSYLAFYLNAFKRTSSKDAR